MKHDVLEQQRKYESEHGQSGRSSAEQRQPFVMPEIGDYCLATKYSDGDPGDHWGLGFYDGMRNGRHYIKDNEGNQIRHGGFRRVGRVSAEVGNWLLNTAAQALESSPPGTVSLWTMLTAIAYEASEE